MPPGVSTSRPARRCSPPPAACRWSSTAIARSRAAAAARTCSRRSALAMPLDAAGGRGLPRRHGLHLSVRAPLPSGHARDRPDARALGVRTVFNILGPLVNPARAAAAPDRRVQPGSRATHGRHVRGAAASSAPSWFTAPTAGMSRRRSGRSRCSTCARGAVAVGVRAPADYGLARLQRRGSGRRRCAAQRARACGPCCRARNAARTAIACCSAPRWRSRWRARCACPARAWHGRPRRSTAARRGACSMRSGSARGRRRRLAGAGERPQGVRHERRFLDEMAAGSRGAVRAAQAARVRRRAREQARALRRCRRDCGSTLRGFDLIAELKLRSPAAGALAAAGRERRRSASRLTPARARPRFRCSPSRAASTARSRT